MQLFAQIKPVPIFDGKDNCTYYEFEANDPLIGAYTLIATGIAPSDAVIRYNGPTHITLTSSENSIFIRTAQQYHEHFMNM